MKYFHGSNKKRHYFEGWYFKQQNERETLALIPAWHIDKGGKAAASLQVIAPEGSWYVEYPARAFAAGQRRFFVELGDSIFAKDGLILNAEGPDLQLKGALRYGPWTPPEGDIMGPFAHIPFLQCRHSLFSLLHRVDGRVSLNDREYVFCNALGYMEGDRGRSFPRSYLWTQVCQRSEVYGELSLMIAVADIPFLSSRFTGCLAVVYLGGRQYRLTTYQGARILAVRPDFVSLGQKDMTLTAELLEAAPHPLQAPESGAMLRVIHESAACKVHYRFTKRGRPLLDFVSAQAGFEGSGGWF